MVAPPQKSSGNGKHGSLENVAPAGWRFETGELGREDVQRLLAFHFEQMRSMSPRDSCHVLPIDGLRGPAISFWSLRDGQRLLTIGALKELESDHGEIKSMRTAPEALGCGAGSAMLRHMVAEAGARGYRRLSLETGSTEAFQPALRLYASHGFQPCAAFAGYRPSLFTRFLTLEL
jgi:putative acetyltransferase